MRAYTSKALFTELSHSSPHCSRPRCTVYANKSWVKITMCSCSFLWKETYLFASMPSILSHFPPLLPSCFHSFFLFFPSFLTFVLQTTFSPSVSWHWLDMKKVTFRVMLFRIHSKNDIHHFLIMKKFPDISVMQYILAGTVFMETGLGIFPWRNSGTNTDDMSKARIINYWWNSSLFDETEWILCSTLPLQSSLQG